MPYNKTLLCDETIFKIEVVDFRSQRFPCKELEKETLILTKEGNHIISIKPSSPNLTGAENFERVVTLKNQEESRVETHVITTVRELADILNEEFGLSVLYQAEKV